MNKWGWKTIAGSILIGAGTAVKLLGYAEMGETIKGLGEFLFGVGVAHKFVKAKR